MKQTSRIRACYRPADLQKPMAKRNDWTRFVFAARIGDPVQSNISHQYYVDTTVPNRRNWTRTNWWPVTRHQTRTRYPNGIADYRSLTTIHHKLKQFAGACHYKLMAKHECRVLSGACGVKVIYADIEAILIDGNAFIYVWACCTVCCVPMCVYRA